jgi:nucleotide-binding universal stress UspA family protein
MTLLVAVADDAVSERILDVAVRLGEGLNEDLYVVHLTTNTTATADERQFRDSVEQYLDGERVGYSVAIEHLDRLDARSERAVGKQLSEIASDTNISHVVVGHSSKTLFGRLTRGDAAFTVADGADVPITIVPN